MREASASEPPMNCRKPIRRCQNRGVTLPPGTAWENPEACPSGIRHVGGAKLNQALVRNVRTCAPLQRERSQAAQTARIRVPMRSAGAEQPVVVQHRHCRPAANETLISWRCVVGIEVDDSLVPQARVVVGPGAPGAPQTVAKGHAWPRSTISRVLFLGPHADDAPGGSNGSLVSTV